MNLAVIFMIKSALYLLAFYLVYVLLLSRDTSYGRNRIFLLISVLLSMVLPLITLHTSRPINIQNFGKMLDEVFITEKTGFPTYGFVFNSSEIVSIISLIYISGAALLLLKLLIDLMNLFYQISTKKQTGSRIIISHSLNTAGFSAMGYIFLNSKLSDEDSKEIIRHEENHLRQNHFIDIILIEVIKALQWFNPAIYFINRSLRGIHEYQADQGCLNSGIPVSNYQTILLNQVFRSQVFNLTNSFSNPSMIKKRIIMMTKKRTPSLAGIKLLLALPAAGLVLLAISANREIPEPPPPPPFTVSDIKESEPFVVVEQMPVFPGGDLALLKYIAENTTYPERARKSNIQGKVVLRFCINGNGSVNRVSVLKGVDTDLDAEAVRVVNTLPPFIPGMQGGKAVPVWYMVPITFTLK